VTRVGFVVSKAVGNAVTRNGVKRRLRHLMVGELAGLPQGTHVVIRALTPAATAPERLSEDLREAVDAVSKKLGDA